MKKIDYRIHENFKTLAMEFFKVGNTFLKKHDFPPILIVLKQCSNCFDYHLIIAHEDFSDIIEDPLPFKDDVNKIYSTCKKCKEMTKVIGYQCLIIYYNKKDIIINQKNLGRELMMIVLKSRYGYKDILFKNIIRKDKSKYVKLGKEKFVVSEIGAFFDNESIKKIMEIYS